MKKTCLIVLLFVIVVFTMYRCKKDVENSPGIISGIVTDTTTNQPIQSAKVYIKELNLLDSTADDGKYQFTDLEDGNYTIEATKTSYLPKTKNADVSTGKTTEINFKMLKNPLAVSNKYLDYGLDVSTASFTISNTGSGNLEYSLSSSQSWISIVPSTGVVTSETDNIEVTINRTGLAKSKIIEYIYISSNVGTNIIRDTVNVGLNGVLDTRDLKYYGIVKIGDQTWLSENLNVGIMRSDTVGDNSIIEKLCYDNNESNAAIYGGLYWWREMMQNNPPDTGSIGTTQGVCMDGWHIPTLKEWEKMIFFLGGTSPGGMGGYFGVGDKLKEAGTSHWTVPNTGATNESGFTALPGGVKSANSETDWTQNSWPFNSAGSSGIWMLTTRNSGIRIWHSNDSHVGDVVLSQPMGTANGRKPFAASVRCIKDPPKNK